MKRMFLFLLLAFLPVAWAQSQWDLWLKNEGFYLLGPKEKEKFLAMPEEQKATYIQNLWDSLDPDPITPENEFQIEYMKRYEYAKKRYGIPSERAKVYLLLGAPNSVESHPNSDKYYPLELWSYYSLGLRDLPSSLDLIFFKRWGTGDYRLYSPLFDGMKALTPSQMDFDNPKQRAMLKAYFDPSVVEAAERMSAGGGVNQSEEVRMILQDPNAFARIERKTRPSVETTVVYEGFQADVSTYSIPYESGVMKTSVAVSIPPQYLTLQREETTYRGRVDLIGRITDLKGKEILRINDSPALKLNGEEFDKAKAYHFSYLFNSYLLPGTYNLDILYRDYASNAAGKVERSFEVPERATELSLAEPLLAFKDIAGKSNDLPFAYNAKQYIPKENATFNNGQTLVIFTNLQNPANQKLDGVWRLQMGLKNGDQNVLEFQEDVPVSGTGDFPIDRKMRLQSLVPGAYVLFLRLTDTANKVYETSVPLRISATPEELGRMRVLASESRTPESFHVNIALQYFYTGQYDLAAKHARIAQDFAPGSYAARSLGARIEQARGNTDVALATYKQLLQESPSDSEGFYLVGKWSLQKQDLPGAADSMKKAIELGYYTTEILNDLAIIEKQMGNMKEAVIYWKKSLELNSDQPDIARMVAENNKS